MAKSTDGPEVWHGVGVSPRLRTSVYSPGGDPGSSGSGRAGVCRVDLLSEEFGQYLVTVEIADRRQLVPAGSCDRVQFDLLAICSVDNSVTEVLFRLMSPMGGSRGWAGARCAEFSKDLNIV